MDLPDPLDLFYRPHFHRERVDDLPALDRALLHWLTDYNEHRPTNGDYMAGRALTSQTRTDPATTQYCRLTRPESPATASTVAPTRTPEALQFLHRRSRFFGPGTAFSSSMLRPQRDTHPSGLPTARTRSPQRQRRRAVGAPLRHSRPPHEREPRGVHSTDVSARRVSMSESSPGTEAAADSAGPDVLARCVADLANKAGIWIAVAESLTGGLVSSLLAQAPDAGQWFAGAIVAYSPHVKHDLLGVPPGPVISAEAAHAIATGALRLLGADAAVSLTGVGGPGPQEAQPPGTVFIAVAAAAQVHVRELHLPGEPGEVCRAAAHAALRELLDLLATMGQAPPVAGTVRPGDQPANTLHESSVPRTPDPQRRASP